ncbi:MAG: hypothetical protein ABIQ73_28025 [Acidimicrobiales bacterium]
MLGVISIGTGAVALFAPLTACWAVGSVGLVATWLVSLAAVMSVVSLIARRTPRGLLGQLGFRRMPVLAAFLVVFALAGHFDTEVGFHEARIVGERSEENAAPRSPADLAVVEKAFLAQNPTGVTPLFVIASSGGGARAAYWTALVLNCLFTSDDKPFGGDQPAPESCRDANFTWNKVAFASGISGGSVGLAMFSSTTSTGVDVDGVFEDGFLDPVIAQLLFGDAPNSLIRYDGDAGSRPRDRAAVLEDAWEDKLGSLENNTLFDSQFMDGKPRLPILLLNSASVGDGCRINVSVVDLAPTSVGASGEKGVPSCRSLDRETPSNAAKPLSSTRDVADFVCTGEDLRLATAALLSARFPFVSPTGALKQCVDKEADYIFAVDGGYVDSSAASPLAEIVPRFVDMVEHSEAKTAAQSNLCFQPIVLQIDNGYTDRVAPGSTDRPRELVAPLIGFGSAGGSRADVARQALERVAAPRACAAKEADKGQRYAQTYFHLYPEARPGIEAPLGWSLSSRARRSLRDQLTENIHNEQEICRLAIAVNGVEGSKNCTEKSDPYEGLQGRQRLDRGWIQMLLLICALVGAVALVRRWWSDLSIPVPREPRSL